MDRLGLPTQELARQVEVTRNYFRSKGEDPAIYAPDFLWFHVTHGRTPQEIYAIALNKHESRSTDGDVLQGQARYAIDAGVANRQALSVTGTAKSPESQAPSRALGAGLEPADSHQSSTIACNRKES